MTTITATGTWTKFDEMWMVRLPVGSVPAVDIEDSEFHFEVVVIKRDGTEQTVSICRTAEFARDDFEIHALSKDGYAARRHAQAVHNAHRNDWK